MAWLTSIDTTDICYSTFLVVVNLIQSFVSAPTRDLGAAVGQTVYCVTHQSAKCTSFVCSICWTDFTDSVSAFYPNVTTLRLGLCYRKSVCRSSVVCNVRAPHSNFRQYFFAVLYLRLSHRLTSTQNFTEIVPGKPLCRGR